MIDEIILADRGRRAPVTLFLHGFTASPLQFAALAGYVHSLGENVYVPRLPRHGHRNRLTEVLRDLSAGELLEHAERSLAVAAAIGGPVRVVGFSLGGLLAASLAQRHDLESAIAIAPLLGVAGVPVRYTSAFAKSLLRLPNAFVWWDLIAREKQVPVHGYPRFPTHALGQLLLIAKDVFERAASGPARSRITLVTNAGESAVNNRAIGELAKLWKAHGAPSVEQHRITGLGLSHDIIEPAGPRAKAHKSYPN
jgi:pimeloyl-ACP methyl ester carboxylesterase